MNRFAITRNNSFIGMAPLVLFLSSYLPLFMIVSVRQIIGNSNFLYWGGFSFGAFILMLKSFGMAILCVFLSLFGLIGTFFVFKNLDSKVQNGYNCKIKEVSSMNEEPLAYVATYIIPIMFEDYSNLTDCITIICIFIVVYLLYVRSKLLLVNPILCLKFSIFNIKYQDGEIIRQGILISKDKDIQEEDSVKIYNVGYQLFYGFKRNLYEY